MAVIGHVPERDGIYIGLVILEMMAKRGKELSRLVADLHARYGVHAFTRNDKHTSPERKEAILIHLAEQGGLTQVAGKAVLKAETIDGFKYHTEDGWLLIRPSGTEPVLRIYAEASSSETSDAMVADAVSQLGV